MEDTEFFDKALRLQAPWFVRGVKLDLEHKTVELEIGMRPGWRWSGRDGQRAHIHGWEERVWRHRDMMEFETTIRARVPRLKLADGSTEAAEVPWAERYARWTLSFEAYAVRVMEACTTLEAAGELLGLDWSSLNRIMQRAVDRGMLRRDWQEMKHMGIDEKSFRRGQSYVTLGCDLGRGVVLEVSEGHDTAAARKLITSVPEEVRRKIQAVAADMSASIATAVHAELPQAELVHDKFHVSKLLGEVVDMVRRAEAKKLEAEGDDTLKNTRFCWLYGQDKLPEKHAVRFEQLAQSNLKTSRAWLAKENFAGFWQQEDRDEGTKFFRAWFGNARRSKLAPLKRVALTLKDHLAGLLAYFAHPITNAVAEGLNSKIQALKHAARGFRSFASYRIRILFFCGGLDLRPDNCL